MREPIWIDERDAIAVHDALLVLHGGGTGVRDRALLESGLARPQRVFAYAQLPDAVGIATVYTAGIVRNQPFVDGNKRTGFLLGILFLELNGYRFTAGEMDAARAVTDFAAGTLDESGYAAFLRANISTE